MASDIPPRDDTLPVNPIAPVVVSLFMAMIVTELAFSLGEREIIGGPAAIGWRLDYIQQFAFSGEIFEWMFVNGSFPFEQVIRTVTYPFLHSSFVHAAIGAVMFIALGKMVSDAYGAVATVILFFACVIMGAVAFAVFTESPAPLLGAFPGVYGFVGAYTYLLWIKLGQSGQRQMRAFSLIGFLMLIQLVFGVLYGGSPTWVADIAAFVVGLALSVLLAPGGWQRFLSRLRQRG